MNAPSEIRYQVYADTVLPRPLDETPFRRNMWSRKYADIISQLLQSLNGQQSILRRSPMTETGDEMQHLDF